jgi:hypothetical protein
MTATKLTHFLRDAFSHDALRKRVVDSMVSCQRSGDNPYAVEAQDMAFDEYCESAGIDGRMRRLTWQALQDEAEDISPSTPEPTTT